MIDGSTAHINLVAGEHVTCVYTNTYVPPPDGLVIQKVTRGGVGSFDYEVKSSGHETHHVTATTTDPGVPATAAPSLDSLDPGEYEISETAPDSEAGHWRAVSVNCNGDRHAFHGGSVKVTVSSGQASVCTFFNRFIPAGSISISKISQGATGTFTFLVGLRNAESAMQYTQQATTKAEGEAADAVPVTPLDATNHLRLGRYLIGEQFPLSDPTDAWAVSSVYCNGVAQPFTTGVVEVDLTRRDPDVHCTYTDTFTPKPPPIPPPPSPRPRRPVRHLRRGLPLRPRSPTSTRSTPTPTCR